MKTVILPGGIVEFEHTVNAVRASLCALMHDSHVLFTRFVTACRLDQPMSGPLNFLPCDIRTLDRLNLTDLDGNIPSSVREIVIRIVDGNGFEMGILG